MLSSSVTVDILAPPDRVWAVLLDVEHWPEWTPTITSIKRLDPGPLALGSRTRIRQPRLPGNVWKVTALDESRGIFIWAAHNPGVVVAAGHLVEPTPTGCRVTHSLAFSGFLGPLTGHLLRGFNQRYLTLEADSLKRRCES